MSQQPANIQIVRDAKGQPTSLLLGSSLEQELLWQIRMAKVLEPVGQLRFAKPRRFAFDMAWPDRKLALEVNGAVWTQGRHTRGAGAESDAEKLSLAAIHGWRVLVVCAKHIRSGQALNWIEQALKL